MVIMSQDDSTVIKLGKNSDAMIVILAPPSKECYHVCIVKMGSSDVKEQYQLLGTYRSYDVAKYVMSDIFSRINNDYSFNIPSNSDAENALLEKRQKERKFQEDEKSRILNMRRDRGYCLDHFGEYPLDVMLTYDNTPTAVRLYKCLKAAEYDTVEEVFALDDATILKIPGVGYKMLELLKRLKRGDMGEINIDE